MEQFNVKTLSAFAVAGKNAAVSSTGALIDYLKETQMHALKNIDTVKYVFNDNLIVADYLFNFEFNHHCHTFFQTVFTVKFG